VTPELTLHVFVVFAPNVMLPETELAAVAFRFRAVVEPEFAADGDKEEAMFNLPVSVVVLTDHDAGFPIMLSIPVPEFTVKALTP
jgi:hypothetical protein